MDDVDRFLLEDLGKEGDITSEALFTKEEITAVIIAKEDCILAGMEEAITIFSKTGACIHPKILDGEAVKSGDVIAEINGAARAILKAERLALNYIGRMSGIASETYKLVQKCHAMNHKVVIAATRKTTPGFRKYEKKAVRIGGGIPHRLGLFDEVMIKDNHLKICGSVEQAIQKIKEKTHGKIIEIEVENKQDARTAACCGVDVIMIDNKAPDEAQEIAEVIRNISPHITIEISGGITEKNIMQYARFADRISLGYLTHSVKSMNFSLEVTNF